MSLLLDLPSELEAELATEAAQFGLPLSNYVLGLLATGRRKKMAVQTSAELVAYWRTRWYATGHHRSPSTCSRCSGPSGTVGPPLTHGTSGYRHFDRCEFREK